MKHFAVFGTHPRLSLAEFRAVKPKLPSPDLFGPAAVFDDPDWDGKELNDRLGGTVKLGDIITSVEPDSGLAQILAETILAGAQRKAVDFGLTIYSDKKKGAGQFARLPLEVKKVLKNQGIPARWVTGKEGEGISPAAVAKLGLTECGTDFCLFIEANEILIGRTTRVQDADAWSLRDYGRPARDQVTGMMPPKIARLMINLAKTPASGALLDPFCGCGTILMEASLISDAISITGSDLDETQIKYAQKNLDWLLKEKILSEKTAQKITLIQADARKIDQVTKEKFDSVVSEGYLGPPLTGDETRETLERNAREISALWRETYVSLLPLLKPKARLVCVWPAFKSSHGMARVDLSEDKEILTAYKIINPLAGWDDSNDPLLYHRFGQRLMRRIVVLEKI